MNEINLFGPLLEKLQKQITLLKQRCLDAEARVAELEGQQAEQQEAMQRLEEENRIWSEKYQNLKAGAVSAASSEEIEDLRNRYLAMIREIDECIDRLNGRPQPLSR
ncbi:MAG: hypothetical protein IJP70_00670 [Bacteroidales bacterium]|nr:hypothetical protein [Bacteroidales bacterium]